MVYLCQTRRLNQQDRDALLLLLSDDERTRAFKFKEQGATDSYIQSHAFKRIVLAEELGTAPESLRFQENEYGKPFIAGLPDNLHFNLSHTQGLTALITSQHHFSGIDVERIREQNFDLIKPTFMHTDEVQEFNGLPVRERPDFFYRTWSVKEAYLKGSGIGFSICPTSIRTIPRNGYFVIELEKKKEAPQKVRYVKMNGFALAYCDESERPQQITDATGRLLQKPLLVT